MGKGLTSSIVLGWVVVFLGLGVVIWGDVPDELGLRGLPLLKGLGVVGKSVRISGGNGVVLVVVLTVGIVVVVGLGCGCGKSKKGKSVG